VPTVVWTQPSRALALERAEAHQPRFKARAHAAASGGHVHGTEAAAAFGRSALTRLRVLCAQCVRCSRQSTANGTPTTWCTPPRSR
jgi:hypothetical protein